MGREIKRVPVDWSWPLGEVWEGFRRPDSFTEAPCPAGEGCYRGSTVAREWVSVIARLLLQLDDDLADQQRGRPMHPYFASLPGPTGFARDADLFALLTSGRGQVFLRPGPDIAALGTGLAGRASGSFGHDAIDGWRATDKLIEAAGLDPKTWGVCPTCDGHGSVEAYPGQRADAEAWKPTEPPSGDGWQMWETVTEGSPVSPVFAAAEELARWLTTVNGGRASGPSHQPMAIDQARAFVRSGWGPTLFRDGDGVHDGVELAGAEEALQGEGTP